MSDHYVICLLLDEAKLPPMRITSTLRNYRQIDNSKLVLSLNHLRDSRPAETDVDTYFS